MNKLSLIASALAVLGLTACEKGLVDDIEDAANGQVTNFLLQVRTRGSSPGDEATVAYPVTVYVFAGEECKAAQTIGDEGQTLNIALVEGSYSVYAVGGAASSDYVIPSVSDALTRTAAARAATTLRVMATAVVRTTVFPSSIPQTSRSPVTPTRAATCWHPWLPPTASRQN